LFNRRNILSIFSRLWLVLNKSTIGFCIKLGAIAMTTNRTVRAVNTLPEHRHGSRLLTRDAALAALGEDLDPFLMVSLYAMRGATFPPHPHAGFMVATYILPESEIGFVNQDSLGTSNRIAPGALHVTVAGSGVLHEEQPEVEGPLAQGFQIWIDLPDALREMPPQALHLAPDHVPTTHRDGSHTRVVLGEAAGLRSPLSLPTSVSLVDVSLQPHAQWRLSLADDAHAFVFMLGGALDAGGHRAEHGQLLRTCADGGVLELVAGTEGARFTVFAGKPLHQTRVARGPFVAGSAEQLMRFAQDHAAGRFGRLQPFSGT
jgi:redox-sensitive bicupin YhaK (pirin superfamily)